MFYIIEINAYGNKHPIALVSGPKDADIDALKRQWLRGVPNLDRAQTEDFSIWLANQDGWSPLSHTRTTLGEYVHDMEGYEATVALWGRCPSGIEERVPCASPHSNGFHVWQCVLLRTGTRVWGCCFCGTTRPLERAS